MMLKAIYSFSQPATHEIVYQGACFENVVGNWARLNQITEQISRTEGDFYFGVGLPSLPSSMNGTELQVKDLAALGFSQRTMMLIIKQHNYLVMPDLATEINLSNHNKEVVIELLKANIKDFMLGLAMRSLGGVTYRYAPTIRDLLFVQFPVAENT
ncbi:MAG: hypothetical protein JNK26_02520 [Candidatus Doudnabacteria bacterium]|nr:hypothetical protein [Candidatus Doudnabacteria bacterium]